MWGFDGGGRGRVLGEISGTGTREGRPGAARIMYGSRPRHGGFQVRPTGGHGPVKRLAIHSGAIIPHDTPRLQWGILARTPGPRFGVSALCPLALEQAPVILGCPRDKAAGRQP